MTVKNTDPFAPWNSAIYKDSPFAPHNSAIDKDSPSKPWNKTTWRREDLTEDEQRYYGLTKK